MASLPAIESVKWNLKTANALAQLLGSYMSWDHLFNIISTDTLTSIHSSMMICTTALVLLNLPESKLLLQPSVSPHFVKSSPYKWLLDGWKDKWLDGFGDEFLSADLEIPLLFWAIWSDGKHVH